MAITAERDNSVGRRGDDELQRYLVSRFGVQQASLLYSYHQLLTSQGPAEVQRLLGPTRYVELLVILRAAGFDL